MLYGLYYSKLLSTQVENTSETGARSVALRGKGC